VDVLVRAAVVAAQVAHVPCGHAATFFTSTNSLGAQGIGQHDAQLNDSVDSCSTRANTAMTDRGRQAERMHDELQKDRQQTNTPTDTDSD
jgi:hypothetical protein